MKKLSIILAIVLIAPAAIAADVSVEVYTGFHSEQDGYSVKTHNGVKVTAALDSRTPLAPYIWGSADILSTRLQGLNGPEYSIFGAGVGLNYNVTDYLQIFGDVGYYHPTAQNLQHFRKSDGLWTMEGVAFYLVDKFGALGGNPGYFDEVHVDVGGDFGGEVGFRLNYPIRKWLFVNLSGAYRMMRIDEAIIGRMDKWSNGYWQYKTQRDLSGPRIGAGITITW